MTGEKPIVINIGTSYQFHEHDTIGAAKREAHRLAAGVNGTFVVYVPVAVIEPAPRTIETEIVALDELAEARKPVIRADDVDDDLAF